MSLILQLKNIHCVIFKYIYINVSSLNLAKNNHMVKFLLAVFNRGLLKFYKVKVLRSSQSCTHQIYTFDK